MLNVSVMMICNKFKNMEANLLVEQMEVVGVILFINNLLQWQLNHGKMLDLSETKGVEFYQKEDKEMFLVLLVNVRKNLEMLNTLV